jgi:2-aminoadipate transaminase
MEPFLSLSFGAVTAGERPGAGRIVGVVARQIAEASAALSGCRLPPIRVLAHQLGVSKNTVSAAYDELKARGLVESREKRGLYVVAPEADLVARPPSGEATPSSHAVPPPRLTPPPTLARALSTARGPGKANAGGLQLSTAFIDPRLLPKERLAACFRAALRRPGLYDFSDPQGYLPLRRAIAARLCKRGIAADAASIVTTVGSQQALDLVARSLSSRTIATEDPAYHMGKALWERSGIELIGLPVDPFSGIDVSMWEQILAARRPGLLYLTPSFQNPTGYSYSSGELSRLLGLSVKLGFGILEDDWGSDMLSYSEFRPSLRALGGSGVLYMNSFTKKLLPSLRVGYVLGDEATTAALLASKRVSVGATPALGEAALHEFLEGGYYDAHLRAVQPELDRRYRLCLELLCDTMPEGVRWTSPGGGPLLWIECPRRVSLPALVERLQARGVVISLSGGAFFREPHLHGFRLGYAFLSPREMEQAVGVLAEELTRALEVREVGLEVQQEHRS